MRILLAALFAVALIHAQTEIPGDTVVAIVNGEKMTADQIKKLVAAAAPQLQAQFARDPKGFLREHATVMALVKHAVDNKLDQQSPYKEQLEFQRRVVLAQAAATDRLNAIDITPEEQQARYKANQERFRQAKVKMIYIPFVLNATPAASGGKKILTDSEAKAKAEGIVKQARAGADFVKLVKQHSEDPGSVAQDGDPGFPVRMNSQQPPEAMRKVILASKAGDVTDALRHDNGYYVFRVESVGVLPYESVRDEIYKEIRDARFAEWLNKTRQSATVQFENEAFFNSIGKQ